MTSQKQPYVRFFPSDWLGGTRGLKAVETGIYITLIALMYERCEPLPDDANRLARQCGCTPSTFRAALDVLVSEGKIIHEGGTLWNKRVENEFDFRREKSQAAKEAAFARWENDNEINDAPMQTQCERNADGMPYHIPYSIEETISSELPTDDPKSSPPPKPEKAKAHPSQAAIKAEFETWYGAYPRHEARGDAFKAYSAARAKIPPDQLLAAAQQFAEKRRGQDPKYTPLPATWLRAERWSDEAVSASGSTAIEYPVNGDDGWLKRLEIKAEKGTWLQKWGPAPGMAGCAVPAAVLARFRPREPNPRSEQAA